MIQIMEKKIKTDNSNTEKNEEKTKDYDGENN